MSVVRARAPSSHSPDPVSWQGVGGNSGDDYGQFRKTGRRRECFPSSFSSENPPWSSHPKGLSSASPSKFAVTPAEFNLFPSARSTGNRRKPQNAELEGQEKGLGVSHLTTLRSAAFWELRRSVIENGERLIRRMRDYEQSRLHQQVRQKVKERKKRGPKFSSLGSRCKARPEASDEDDVLICSEDTSKGLWSPLGARTGSLDLMDVDGQDPRRNSQSAPVANYSHVQFRYDEHVPFTGNSLRTEKAYSDSLLSYVNSASPTPSSSSLSLPLPQSMTSGILLPLQTTSSKKALAELNYAFANGACSIADYSPIWTYQQQQLSTGENDTSHGDLWR